LDVQIVFKILAIPVLEVIHQFAQKFVETAILLVLKLVMIQIRIILMGVLLHVKLNPDLLYVEMEYSIPPKNVKTKIPKKAMGAQIFAKSNMAFLVPA